MDRRALLIVIALGVLLLALFSLSSSTAENLLRTGSAESNTAQSEQLFDFVSVKKLRSSISSAGVAEQEITINLDQVDFEWAQTLTFPLFDGQRHEAIQRSSEGFIRFGPGEFGWRGKISGAVTAGGDVVLTVKDRAVSGLIYAPDAVYEIVPQKDFKHLLVQVDQSRFPPCGTGNEDVIKSAKNQEEPIFDTVASDDGTQIDVLVVYTTPVRNALGGTTQTEVFAQQAVNAANTAYQNSDITPRLRLAGTMEAANYTENGLNDALNWARTDANVAAMRNTTNADLVAILVESDPANCGVGALMRTVRPSFAFSAFSATRRSCAVGNLTFAHELGHNQGCEHNPENGGSPSTASYPFAFGHYVDGAFRTVMSYTDPCPTGCPRVAHFSNPNVFYGGVPTGVLDQRDNHQVINNTALIVSQFRSSTGCAAPGAFAQSSPGDGESVSSPTTSVALSWSSSANATAYEVFFGPNPNVLPLVGSQAATSRNVTVSAGQAYYWRVLAYGCNGLSASTPTRSFSVSSVGTSAPFQILLEQFAPVPNLVSAVDSILLLRDPFPVVNGSNLLNSSSDKNTRVLIFLSNFQLQSGETSASVVINLVGSNNQSYDVAAEDVRALPNSTFTQVVFRLPNSLAVGNSTVTVKARGQLSNSGIIRIRS
ncbi:MAG TPA: zinc-dependent metalloprotease family protein [Pyrinomonadaceae bacterium]|nr:zinc-dependent metalloprotease family protein [Pyrinomonadaceae bacterium]